MAKPEIDEVLNLRKRRGETPLQTIERYVARHHAYAKATMTYAGRLDPMAEGVLVVLAGAQNSRRAEYLGLDKEYEFEFFLGFDTDTHDTLGLVRKGTQKSVSREEVEQVLKKYKGTFNQKYPAYSSKTVDGTALFTLARAGKINDADLPTHEVTVESIELTESREVKKEEILSNIRAGIEALSGDFRQAEILERWQAVLDHPDVPSLITVYKVRVSCQSGFYVRRLVYDMGIDLGTGAVTYSIVRTRVGEYRLADSV